MRAAIIVLVVLALAGGGWYGYRQFASPPDRGAYRTEPVQRRNIVSTVSATGTVQPLLKVLVGSQVSGTVMAWYADFNQRVQQGFVLAELDQDRVKALLDQRTAAVAVAQAQVEEAQARLDTASLQRQQIEEAYERSASSTFELRSTRLAEAAARAALHAAEAQSQATEADRRQAASDLEKTVIRAPIDGVIISRDVDAGQTVAASLSAPTLFTIANDLAKMRVEAAVSETDIGKVHEGMEAEFRVDAYPGRRFRGTVAQVRYAETVVDNVVTYTTIIDVSNDDLALRPGMTATILFELARAENVLAVPNAALRFNPDARAADVNWIKPGRGQAIQPRVYGLQDGALVEIPVALGLNDGSFTEVKSDELHEGDAVVVDQERTRTQTALQRMPR